MADHTHVMPRTEIRRAMVVQPLWVFLATLPLLALNIVARSLEIVGTGPAALWNLLGVVGGLGSFGVWVFLLVRPFFRRPAERDVVRAGKSLAREQAVLMSIACPTCHVAGAVGRSTDVGQFACGRCGYRW